MRTALSIRMMVAALALAAGAIAGGPARATPVTLTPVLTGPETTLAAILDGIGAAGGGPLERVPDQGDALWRATGVEPARARAWARFASLDNAFGVVPGAAGGLDGFAPLVSGVAPGRVAPGGWFALPVDELFRLAIRAPGGRLYTSRAADNADGADHMVTWADAGAPGRVIVAFEDLSIGRADRDYNDLVLELRGVAPVAVSEPAGLPLLGAGLAGLAALGLARRRRSRPVGG